MHSSLKEQASFHDPMPTSLFDRPCHGDTAMENDNFESAPNSPRSEESEWDPDGARWDRPVNPSSQEFGDDALDSDDNDSPPRPASESCPKSAKGLWRHPFALKPSHTRRIQQRISPEIQRRSTSLARFITALLADRSASTTTDTSRASSSATSNRDARTPTTRQRIIPTLNRSSSGSIDLLGNRPFTFSGPDIRQMSGSNSRGSTSMINLSSSSLLPLSPLPSHSVSSTYSLAGTSFEKWIPESPDSAKKCAADTEDSFVRTSSSDEIAGQTPGPPLRLDSDSAALPTEMLQQIYAYLSPQDLNSARHVCRSWMTASLHHGLLMSAIRRGGWASAVEGLGADSLVPSDKNFSLGNQWMLSCILARECALSNTWKGNGLTAREKSKTIKNRSEPNPWVVGAYTDFADLASGYAGPQSSHSSGLVFTTSVCGKFALVAEGGMIYIYELQGTNLSPVTSVVCPRRVLTVSMDTSAGRYAIAALLDGRMGLVCDLNIIGNQSQSHAQDHEPPSAPSSYYPPCVQVSRPLTPPYSDVDAELQSVDAINVENSRQSIDLYDTQNGALGDVNMVNRTWNLQLHSSARDVFDVTREDASTRGVPVETGVRNIYRHLCSEDDPPRSVAICPTRNCVAFGCAAGIELHWVDAVTGHDFSRWFPLTAESDYLYFLPPRPGVDSATKLRLISSAGHPSMQRAMVRRFFTSKTRGIFWMPCRRPTAHTSSSLNCDHFHAIPLSDGRHMIFTDPQSGMLVFGCDAPIGSPQKLLRKIYLLRPKNAPLRKIYSAAYDLTWGARIVVGYDDRLVIYNIPPDIIVLSALEQSLEVGADPDSRNTFPAANDTNRCSTSTSVAHIKSKILALRQRLAHWAADFTERRSETFAWPLYISGTEIGAVSGLVDLAVQTSPRLAIWAFGQDGWTVTWQLGSGTQNPSIMERTIARDGRVVEILPDTDRDGLNADETDFWGEGAYERTMGFDGHDSTTPRENATFSGRDDGELDFMEIPQAQVWYTRKGEVWIDNDGDVWMSDV